MESLSKDETLNSFLSAKLLKILNVQISVIRVVHMMPQLLSITGVNMRLNILTVLYLP